MYVVTADIRLSTADLYDWYLGKSSKTNDKLLFLGFLSDDLSDFYSGKHFKINLISAMAR